VAQPPWRRNRKLAKQPHPRKDQKQENQKYKSLHIK